MQTPTFTAASYMPLVRAGCKYYENFTTPSDYWEYPYFPDRGRSKTTYKLPPHKFLNSTAPAATWRTIPGPDDNSVTVNDSTLFDNYYPSAFIDVQMPKNGTFNGTYSPYGAFMSCSVDARWIWSDNVGLDFDSVFPGRYYVAGKWPDEKSGKRFP